NYQTAEVGERALVLGAEIGLSASQADWSPLEFVMVPWAELDSIRCEMELGVGFNSKAVQQASVIVPPGGAALWAIAVETNGGKSELVLVRNKAPAEVTNATNARVPEASGTNVPDFSSLQRWLTTSALIREGKSLYESSKYDE